MGARGNGELFNGCRVSFEVNEKLLEMIGGSGCAPM